MRHLSLSPVPNLEKNNVIAPKWFNSSTLATQWWVVQFSIISNLSNVCNLKLHHMVICWQGQVPIKGQKKTCCLMQHTKYHRDRSFTTSSMLYSLLWQIWENSMWPSYRLDLSLLSQQTALCIKTSPLCFVINFVWIISASHELNMFLFDNKCM